nr:hypothetical protein [Chlamydiota bacterium]
MRILITLLLLIFSTLSGNQASTPSELSSLQGDPSAFIWDCVNAITGDLVFSQEDTAVKGAEPLFFRRHYISREVKNPNLHWDPYQHVKAVSVYTNALNLFVPEPNGIILQYSYSPRLTKEKGKIVRLLTLPLTLSPSPGQFEKGIVHQMNDQRGNSYNPIENLLELDKDRF